MQTFDYVIHNPSGSGAVNVPGIGHLGNGEATEKKLAEARADRLRGTTQLAVARAGTPEAGKLLKAGENEAARRSGNMQLRADHAANVTAKRNAKPKADRDLGKATPPSKGQGRKE